jgi:hypothetical protein
MKEELDYTKGAIRICISKKNRQHNGQNQKYKRTNNDQQSIHNYKTKDRVTRTALKTRVNSGAPGRVSSSCSTSDTCHVNLVTKKYLNKYLKI